MNNKVIEFNILNVAKKIDSVGKEEKIVLTLDPTEEACEDIVYAPKKYLISYESIIRKQ